MGEHELLTGNFYYYDRNEYRRMYDIDCTATTNNISASGISSSDLCTTTASHASSSDLCDSLHDALSIFSNRLSTAFNIDWKDASALMIKDFLNDEKEEETMDLHPVKIIFNDPVSVVFWEDGEKTVVRRHEGEPYDKYTAFCAALAIKIFGSNTEVNRIVRSGIDQQEKDLRKAEKIAKKQEAEKLATITKKVRNNG